MAEKEVGPGKGGSQEISLKDKGNEFFKAGNYLKAAALYTQAIKQDPSNPALYSNRAAAFLNLAMEQYDDALAAFQIAVQYNPQSAEVSRKIKRLSQLAKDNKRAQEVQNLRSNVDIAKGLETLKSEMVSSLSKMDPRVYFLLDKEKTQTDKFAPVVNIDKAFESPHTHSNCFSFIRQYAEDFFSRAASLVAPKSIISYPQVWKGQGSRKWKHGQHDGFFVQFESPILRKLWFISSSYEMGKTLCRDPEVLDIGAHEVLPRLFKEKLSKS
ncbi:hypothetical protein F3Y22_tig00110474pilonHSYRG00022 [Hibiscus syriacus]|uniref:Uncharacterized protein n=1 Tax=Hibiscus syriacus TaxID=106335 RepID=A0A6A3AJV5_HIBSY|nr:hypothetical protein F3Y22_tig00110474pilonHSYRG00022 [Hibiscus syriacus]